MNGWRLIEMVSLGIDIGGTGCKCVAFRENGEQLALSYLEYPNPAGNGNIQATALRDAVFSVTAQCVKQLENPQEIVAITISSFGESFVPVDEAGCPLTDIILYFADSENGAFKRKIAQIGIADISEITRVLPDASYSLSKMLTAPGNTHMFLFVASYIVFLLTGKAVCDVSLACRTLLYDVRRGCWSEKLLAKTGIQAKQLPTVLPTGAEVGEILPEVAWILGLPDTVKVVMGSHDQIVNALGAGVAVAGEAVDTTGTCECITPLFRDMPGEEFIRNNFACVPYLQDSGFVTYAYNISGGAAVRWYRDALVKHLRSQAESEHCSIYDLLNCTCPADPTGLLIMPFVQGMGGTPDIAPNATASISGITAATTLPEIYRGLLEGLCYEMRYNLERMEEGGVFPQRLYACGGGARSKVWLQIKADVWGREIIPVETEETGALGSAILGFAAVTGEKDIFALAKKFTRHGTPVLPDAGRHAYYTVQYERYKRLRKFYLEEMY